jgi:RNA polymerase sigma-70 factor (ECF subfamily)
MAAADEPQHSESGEQQLILDAKGGDSAAFRRLVQRHMRQTYNIALGFVRDHDRAEEIAQEVFVKAHRSLASFRGEAEFGTWLYRITTNIALNHMKVHRRKEARTVSIEEAATLHDEHSPLEANDHSKHIERALHELPTMQRAVVILRHLDGLSTRQVSRILKCSEGTVKTHLFRGLKRMRSKLLFLRESRI